MNKRMRIADMEPGIDVFTYRRVKYIRGQFHTRHGLRVIECWALRSAITVYFNSYGGKYEIIGRIGADGRPEEVEG